MGHGPALIYGEGRQLGSSGLHHHTHTDTHTHTLPGGVLILAVDADGLSSAVPLAVVEEAAVLGAGHVVGPLRLRRGDHRRGGAWARITERDGDEGEGEPWDVNIGLSIKIRKG